MAYEISFFNYFHKDLHFLKSFSKCIQSTKIDLEFDKENN